MHSAETPGNTGERDRRTLVVIENRKPSEQKAVGFLHHTAGGKDDQRDDTLGRAGGWWRVREHRRGVLGLVRTAAERSSPRRASPAACSGATGRPGLA